MENDKQEKKISPESGRGLGHVTSTMFGSTVGYPSDSLAYCSLVLLVKFIRGALRLVLRPVTTLSCLKLSYQKPKI